MRQPVVPLRRAVTSRAGARLARGASSVRAAVFDLRCGDYREVLADETEVDLVCCDPPYSERTHQGHDSGANLTKPRPTGPIGRQARAYRSRRAISYDF